MVSKNEIDNFICSSPDHFIMVRVLLFSISGLYFIYNKKLGENIMKKNKLFLSVLFAALLFTSCTHPGNNSGESNPTEKDDPQEPQPDPINIEEVKFLISDYPETTNNVRILRKEASEKEYFLYSSVWVRFYNIDFIPSFEYIDPFVEPGKTYNYLLQFAGDTDFTTDQRQVLNGESEKFTPSKGKGEIIVNDPYPEITYYPNTKTLSFSDNISISPDIEQESKGCDHFISVTISKYFSSFGVNFKEIEDINLRNQWIFLAPNAPTTNRKITDIIPGYRLYLASEDGNEYQIEYNSKCNLLQGKEISID